MRRSLAWFLALIFTAACPGCGTVFIGFKFAPPVEASGFVSFVQVRIISTNDGTQVTVTAVTLVNSGLSQTRDFCGNVASQFPMNSFVVVSFNPGVVCGTVVAVHLSG